jgi:4-phospho-D-threonate 3-dehydrogenase / 4-phospho-D-erythronate 3-dehydrogenase
LEETVTTIALTMGDPAGIGPEIVAKTIVHDGPGRPDLRLVAVGDIGTMRAALDLIEATTWNVRALTADQLATAPTAAHTIDVVQAGSALGPLEPGVVSAHAGQAAVDAVRTAVDLLKSGRAIAMATAPLNKAAMHAAGTIFPGHTELLAHEFGVSRVSLALGVGGLYLLHATTHVSLRNACDLVTTQRVADTIELAQGLAKSLGTPDEEICVLGLNPHAGEGGLFGDEDDTRIRPAVEAAQRRGANVVGPLPADAALPQAFRGRWKLVVAMYHDQGHVAFKSVAGDRGVNVTVGIPKVRTSVDHGTAFDIAWQGIARHESMTAAVDLAAALAPRWT